MSMSRLLATFGLIVLGGCAGYHDLRQGQTPRTIRADIVALDQPITYNRFGSFNPYGMIYALSNDVEIAEAHRIGESNCPAIHRLKLKDEVRPRPLVLRGNQGDRLQVRFTNNLLPNDPDFWGPSGQPNMSKCRWHDVLPAPQPEPSYDPVRYNPYPDHDYAIDHGNHRPEARREAARDELAGEGEVPGEEDIDAAIDGQDSTDWPATRTASFVVSGMTALRGATCEDYDAAPNDPSIWLDPSDPRVTGIRPIQPGECFVYDYVLGEPGTHLFFSLGAPSGGQGDGGSLVHGLFGSVNVQPRGSRFYRSQVSAEVMEAARAQAAGSAFIDFEATDGDGTPLLNMLKPVAGRHGVQDLVHGDLNAIVVDCDGHHRKKTRCRDAFGNRLDAAFREFTVIFHDELKTFYPEPIRELGEEYQLEGIGDGFAINYGASGMGGILLANRKGFGPARDCLECLYEEFFLQSWANGDPALLARYEDDPANVHHSYLGDRAEFRNLHAGPKETHVFHLHAHQWLAQQDEPGSGESFGTYLDSQTIAPQQGFAYNIYYGGSGNRNQTPGDSIFHCHLYPHFAQGMWALWRVHDVLEDGSRHLPDGEAGPGTDPYTGDSDGGTPIPALVPLPQQAMPPMPTYGENGMPGYPFYIPGLPGHRAPQPPLDFVETAPDEWKDGGLPRHVFTGAGVRSFGELELGDQQRMSPEELVQYALRTGDFSAHIESAEIDLLSNRGEPIEQTAMDFHAGDAPGMTLADGTFSRKDDGRPGYRSITPEGTADRFLVNNAPPRPGAPFADPCRADLDADGKAIAGTGPAREIGYDVAAIQLDLIVNKAGWHDPQARINVLTRDAPDLEFKTTGDAEPFFFRAGSGDCVEFRHQNRTPKDLELDDFQVKTPTDTIGQHIHLVKFDVTSSDGSGNGFNYEDGTLAPDEVADRIEAAKAFTDAHGSGDGDALTLPGEDEETFQTTVQRWYADPLLSGPDGADRTIRTVFTHDHFAPSSIQHHGFYSALLVEPRESAWYTAGGERMCPEFVDGAPCADRPAVGAKAIIKVANDAGPHQDHREFAMAIADFGLLYDPQRGGGEEAKGLDNLVAALEAEPLAGVDKATSNRLIEDPIDRRSDIRDRHGVPVDPPLLPESISKNHHNPYLVNYRNEPLPLRIGENGPAADDACGEAIRKRIRSAGEVEAVSLEGGAGDVGDGVVVDDRDRSVRRQKPREALIESGGRAIVVDYLGGDLSRVFSSDAHGDPCTPVVEAYEGERLQIRMIQGAQEVQHMFEVQGVSWPREIANPSSPEVAAQEIGISEHFEMEIGVDLSSEPVEFSDHLYRFSTVDDLWNGAWGLLRSYEGTGSREPPFFTDPIGDRLKPVAIVDRPGVTGYRASPAEPTIEGFAFSGACPADAPVRFHAVDAVTLKDVFGRHRDGWQRALLYNGDHSISDPDALAFMPVHSTVPMSGGERVRAGEISGDDDLFLNGIRDEPRAGAPASPIDVQRLADAIRSGRLAERARYRRDDGPRSVEPMVLRAKAGECVIVRLRNLLLHDVDGDGEAVPRSHADILNDNVADNDDVEAHVAGGEGYDPRHLPRIVPLNAVELQASEVVGITPQLMRLHVGAKGGAEVGYGGESSVARPGAAVTYHWYAGRIRHDLVAGTIDRFTSRVDDGRRVVGAVNLVSLTDPIEHGQQGLIGAMIVEEATAVAIDPETGQAFPDLPNGTRAYIDPDGRHGDARPFHEFVLMYQDGLNLRWRNPDQPGDRDIEAVPDCLVCDDSYDRGEKAVNYRTEPFWARLNQHPTTDLNSRRFPAEFFLDDWKTIATPAFEVREGEAVTFHVLQPYGRARQRAFMVLGHDYLDLLPHFGSRHSALISVGKAVKAEVSTTDEPRSHKAAAGDWIWRDGPAQHVSSGAWGRFEVEADER